MPDIDKKYQHFLVGHNDKNVILHDGEDMKNEKDVDMRNSMLLTIYLCMSACYIKSKHYTLAM